MNPKRLVLAIMVVFVAVWVTDFLIHQVWLASVYAQTLNLWRPEGDIQKHMAWLFFGELVAAIAFVVIWAAGPAAKATIGCACLYGLFMGLFSQAGTLISYAVQPLPAELAAKWFIAGTVRAVLLGLLVFAVYRPRPAITEPVK